MLAGISSCSIYVDGHNEKESWENRQDSNRNIIANLKLGATKSDVMALLGEADFTEALRNKEQQDILVLFYRTQHHKSDGRTSRDETTPLVFSGNVLIGWGEIAYNKSIH